MNNLLLNALDHLFFLFHTTLTIFNLIGWLLPRTRFLHLISVALTACSWFVFGIWYGWGYCILTDWHWDIRRQLGQKIETNSYIDYLIRKITGWQLNPDLIDQVVMVLFILIIFLTIFKNALFYRRKYLNQKRSPQPQSIMAHNDQTQN